MAMTLLEISQLKKSFTAPDGAAHGVVNIKEFHLAEREHAALQGESGCGKTTFLHLIAGILKPDSGAIKIAGAGPVAGHDHRLHFPGV